tara:strand:+ start:639 stop:854 length:216 start_codon:yes stop_codon:yes gene_type:complete
MSAKAKTFKGFSISELIYYLKKIEKRNPKAQILIQQCLEGEQPLNIIQEPIDSNLNGKAFVLNSLYEEEFN